MVCVSRPKRPLLEQGFRGILAVATVFAVWAVDDARAGRYADYVIEANSQTILNQNDAHSLKHPASLTKIMTLYLVFDAMDRGLAKLDDRLPVSKNAAKRPASKLGLKAGQSIALSDAILALVIKSANDVATVVAEHFGGTETAFAQMMTKQARTLGMSQTTYKNASGLYDPGQQTTAYDQIQLARAVYADFPHYTHYFTVTKFKYGKRVYRTHNNLLGKTPGVEGIKTGYINASGYNLMTSTRRDGRHVFAVVLGGKSGRSRDAQMRRLIDRGFARLKRYETVISRIARPKPKPSARIALLTAKPVAAPAPPPPPAPTTEIGRAADAVGEVLSDVVAIPRAQAAELPPPAWGVQVGAFSARVSAESALDAAVRTVPDLLAGTIGQITAVRDSRGTLYRARRIGLSEVEARQACAVLQSRSLPCIVARPEPRS